MGQKTLRQRADEAEARAARQAAVSHKPFLSLSVFICEHLRHLRIKSPIGVHRRLSAVSTCRGRTGSSSARMTEGAAGGAEEGQRLQPPQPDFWLREKSCVR